MGLGLSGNLDCTPGYYYDNEMGYPGGPVAFFEYIDRWRQSGTFDGLDFRVRSRA